MTQKELKDRFQKVCINASPSCTIHKDGSKECIIYRREDFYTWAKEALERGEDYFYHEPINPENPCGKHHLCEPKYVYRMISDLTVEEYESLFGKDT